MNCIYLLFSKKIKITSEELEQFWAHEFIDEHKSGAVERADIFESDQNDDSINCFYTK